MNATLTARPTETATTQPSSSLLDLRGLDHYARRQRLAGALHGLETGQTLHVTCTHCADVLWLRYEMEALTGRCFRWSPLAETPVTARVAIRLP